MSDEPIIDKLERLEREAEDWAGFVGDVCPVGKHADYAIHSENGSSCPGCAIDALISQHREQRERADRKVADWKLALKERDDLRHTVREQREALRAISEFGCDECDGDDNTCLHKWPAKPTNWCQTCIALAALAPNTEGEGTDG